MDRRNRHSAGLQKGNEFRPAANVGIVLDQQPVSVVDPFRGRNALLSE